MSDTSEPPLPLNSRLLEAQDENTSPERLTEIYNDCQEGDDGIKQALTLNPNTPLEILIKLCQYYPAEFLENPALDLHLLTLPNLLAEMPIDSLLSILRLPQAPPEFILFALNNRRNRPKGQIEGQILAIVSYTHPEIWQEWLKNNENIFKRANLKDADLQGANLEDADLSDANLEDANLEDADLSGANLSGANLRGVKLNEETIIDEKWRLVWDIVNHPIQRRNLKDADLDRANLKGANLWGANLEGAYLGGADLWNANLSGANLSGAKLWSADLWNANLGGANLQNADLSGAYLNGACLIGADLRGADLTLIDFNLDSTSKYAQPPKLSGIIIDEETKIDPKYSDFINSCASRLSDEKNYKFKPIKTIENTDIAQRIQEINQIHQDNLLLEQGNKSDYPKKTYFEIQITNNGQNIVYLAIVALNDDEDEVTVGTWKIDNQEKMNSVSFRSTLHSGYGLNDYLVPSLFITEDGRIVYINSEIIEFDAETGEQLYCNDKWYKEFYEKLAGAWGYQVVSSDRRFLAIVLRACEDECGSLAIWDVVDRRVLSTFNEIFQHYSETFLFFIPHTDFVLIKNEDDDKLFLLDVFSGEITPASDCFSCWTDLDQYADQYTDFMTPSGKKIIKNGNVYNWTTNDDCFPLEDYPKTYMKQISVSENFLVVADKELTIWSLDTGKIVDKFTSDCDFNCCRITPNNKIIVAGDVQGKIHLFNLETE